MHAPAQHDAHASGNAAAQSHAYLFLTHAEVAFIDAAVSHLIPADELGPGAKEALKGLDGGSIELEQVGSQPFFEMLLANTVEGFLADPVHGGNLATVDEHGHPVHVLISGKGNSAS